VGVALSECFPVHEPYASVQMKMSSTAVRVHAVCVSCHAVCQLSCASAVLQSESLADCSLHSLALLLLIGWGLCFLLPSRLYTKAI